MNHKKCEINLNIQSRLVYILYYACKKWMKINHKRDQYLWFIIKRGIDCMRNNYFFILYLLDLFMCLFIYVDAKLTISIPLRYGIPNRRVEKFHIIHHWRVNFEFLLILLIFVDTIKYNCKYHLGISPMIRFTVCSEK